MMSAHLGPLCTAYMQLHSMSCGGLSIMGLRPLSWLYMIHFPFIVLFHSSASSVCSSSCCVLFVLLPSVLLCICLLPLSFFVVLLCSPLSYVMFMFWTSIMCSYIPCSINSALCTVATSSVWILTRIPPHTHSLCAPCVLPWFPCPQGPSTCRSRHSGKAWSGQHHWPLSPWELTSSPNLQSLITLLLSWVTESIYLFSFIFLSFILYSLISCAFPWQFLLPIFTSYYFLSISLY